MLNVPKLIQKLLNGTGDKPRAAKLQKLRKVSVAARANLPELERQRAKAYLDDIGEEEISAIEEEIERLEQEEAAERRLSDSRAESQYLELYATARNLLKAADEAFADLSRAWGGDEERLRRRGWSPFVFAGFLGQGFGLAWATEQDRVVAAGRQRDSRPQPARPVVQKPALAAGKPPRLPHERAPITDSHGPVYSSFDNGPPRAKQAQTTDDLAPLEPGEARVRVLRAGFSPADDRPQCRYGQVIRMPRAVAQNAANRGAVEVLEIGEPATAVAGADWKTIPAGTPSVSGAVAAENLGK